MFNFFFIKLIYTNICLYLKNINEFGVSLFFYILIVSLFPVSLGTYFVQSKFIVPSILWISVLLSILLTLDSVFKTDYNNGFYDHFIFCAYPLHVLVFARVVAHWFIVVVPLIIVTPLLGLLFALEVTESLVLFVSLFLGTPALCFLGAIGSSLLVTTTRGGVLLALIVLPFYIPVLIFGSSSVLLLGYGLNVVLAQFALLGAISMFTALFAPFVISWSFKVGILS